MKKKIKTIKLIKNLFIENSFELSELNLMKVDEATIKVIASCWAVTGTFHGSIIEAETEGEARRIFHKHYNGESITHIKKRNVPAWDF